jgi:hypothetical protein
MAVTQPRPLPPRRPARRPRLFWSRLHFLIRFVGLTGFMAGCVGLVLAGLGGRLSSMQALIDDAWAVLRGQPAEVSTWLILVGALAVLFTLLVEALVVVQRTAGRRSAFGFNALVQVGLATALLVGVNVLSAANLHFSLFGRDFSWRAHYLRLDWTRSRQFTLPPETRAQLEQLDPRSQTTVVVYQQHKTLGALNDKPDRYDSAAERKVVEKVKDLVEQLRELGPRFRVEVLDVDDERYDQRLADLTKDAPELRHAIESTPENCLFFYSRDEAGTKKPVQRLSFNDFYLLDKAASQEGRGNLVLLSQGVGPFARRVLNLDEKRPRIGIGVIHLALTTTGQQDIGLIGLRKALEARGFEVQDVILKRWSRFAPPEAAVSTVDESKLDSLEAREAVYTATLAGLQRVRTQMGEDLKVWEKAVEDKATRDDLTRRFARPLRGRPVTPELAKEQVAGISEELKDLDEALEGYRERLQKATAEKKQLNEPALAEQRRLSDVKAKFARLLADCDLLILPRLTLQNTANDFENIPARLHRLDDAQQVEAIKEFLKAGKPVLACFGPANEPDDAPRRPGDEGNRPEGVEELLGQLGIKFGKQTVLFDVETEAFADRRSGLELAGTTVEVPPVEFEWKPGAGRVQGQPVVEYARPNRLRESMRLAARSLGAGKTLELRLRHPRPVYYDPPAGRTPRAAQAAAALALASPEGPAPGLPPSVAALGVARPEAFTPPPEGARSAFDPVFLMTSARSWNEDQPFPTAERIPQFEKPKPRAGEREPAAEASTDPLDARRRGPFPVGVNVERVLPEGWFDSPAEARPTVRLAAIGQGGFFTGKELRPAQEKLMVNTLNWLLGRDDYLPRADRPWSYPRIDLQPGSEEQQLWLWGARLGLPAVCAYLGLVVLLLRRLR